MEKIFLGALIGVSALVLQSQLWAGGSSSVGPRNPAVARCLQAGGDLIYMDGVDGTPYFSNPARGWAACRFDHAQIEQWSLFYATTAPFRKTQAVQAFLGGRRAQGAQQGNPASVNCQAHGGEIRMAADSRGNQWGICEFADGSSIEEWTLFLGPQDSRNQGLKAALTRQKLQAGDRFQSLQVLPDPTYSPTSVPYPYPSASPTAEPYPSGSPTSGPWLGGNE